MKTIKILEYPNSKADKEEVSKVQPEEFFECDGEKYAVVEGSWFKTPSYGAYHVKTGIRASYFAETKKKAASEVKRRFNGLTEEGKKKFYNLLRDNKTLNKL